MDFSMLLSRRRVDFPPLKMAPLQPLVFEGGRRRWVRNPKMSSVRRSPSTFNGDTTAKWFGLRENLQESPIIFNGKNYSGWIWSMDGYGYPLVMSK